MVVTYKHLSDPNTLNTLIVKIRHWDKRMKLVVRNDKTGLWGFSNIAEPLPPVESVPSKAVFTQIEHTPNPAVADLRRSFVYVSCTIPVHLEGFPKNYSRSMGVVIDADKGLVVISRAIADSIVVEGKVMFLHPVQNYAIIQYDPKLVDAPVRSRFSPSEELRASPTIPAREIRAESVGTSQPALPTSAQSTGPCLRR